ncbi:hypothetical protein N9R81_05745, partial [Flavobacteriales bacterium]|nr:hypothetical protein [Flavobacteriales bacterium]
VLKKFNSGAFSIALRRNIPIIPIVINGTGNILAKTSNRLNFQCDLSVEMLNPITSLCFANKSARELADYVWMKMNTRIEKGGSNFF